MPKYLPILSYISFFAGIFVNFFWIYQRQTLSLQSQLCLLGLTILLILLGAFLGGIARSGGAKQKFFRAGFWILFVYYLYILAMLLFFGGLFGVDRSYSGDFQLVPFHTIRNYAEFYHATGSFVGLSNLLGNVVVLMPFGFFFPVLFPKTRKFWIFFPLVALIALGVELVQWKTGTGIGDIDDSILNFLGAVLAYCLTRGVQLFSAALK